jgi:hypothetical protein
MNIAFIQHTQHDDRGDGGDNQDHLRVHRVLKYLGGTGKAAANRGGTPSWVMVLLMASVASDSEEPVGRLNDMVDAADSPDGSPTAARSPAASWQSRRAESLYRRC